MSLLWIDGFEGYGTSIGSAPSPSGVMTRRYAMGSESSIDVITGRISGKGINCVVSACSLKTPAININATIIIGFAVKITLDNTDAFLELYDDAVLGINLQYITGGELRLRRGVTTLGTTVGLGLTIGDWYWIELKVFVDNAAGTYELRVGGANVLSAAGVDTQEGVDTFYNIVQLGSSATYPWFDDFYVCDGAGAINNDFLGNCHITAIFPDGVGNTTDFTPSAGANWFCVSEEIVDDDTNYIEDSTPANKDTYTYDDVGALINIKGLQINTDCRETDASAFSLITVVRSNGADDDDAAQAIGTTDYVTKRRVAELDPDTAAAWLAAAINAAEFGVKVG